MFNNFKSLRAGDLKNVDDGMAYPLLRWCSGSQIDLHWCAEVNQLFFGTPNDVILGLLYCGLKDSSKYIPYPKAKKEKEDKVFELKKSLLMRYYGWGLSEFEKNLSILEFVDFEEIAIGLGCNEKERKALGLPIMKLAKIKYKEEPDASKPKKKTIFEFGK